MLGDADASQGEVDNAVTTLQAATATYEASLEVGTKTASKQLSANTIKLRKSTFVKTANRTRAQTFALGASSTSGKLVYSVGKAASGSVSVSAAGKVTIEKNWTGKATITVKSPATSTHKAAASKSVVVKVKAGKLATPKVVNVKTRKLEISWSKMAGADKYQVRYKRVAAKKWTAKNLAGTKATWTTGKLARGKTYRVQVRAYDKETKTWGAWSPAKKVKVRK